MQKRVWDRQLWVEDLYGQSWKKTFGSSVSRLSLWKHSPRPETKKRMHTCLETKGTLSLGNIRSHFWETRDRLCPRRGPQSVFLTFIELFLFYYFYLIGIPPPGTRFRSRLGEACILHRRGFYLRCTRDVSFGTRFWSLFSYRNWVIYEVNVTIFPLKNDEKTETKP